MSAKPKVLRILEAVQARLQAIRQVDGYFSDIGGDVRLDYLQPDRVEAPLAMLFPGVREVAEDRQTTSAVSQAFTIEAFVQLSAGLGAVETGIWLWSDIHRAVEQQDNTLGGLVFKSSGGLQCESEEILYPEAGSNVVGVSMTYAIPHRRRDGDPEIA